ncbi:SAM-dependent methyltransferase [Roseateles amylovorans]|uniref:Cyclopropane-fatty-acyl-phospholipid synthase family protein n=1 Tax=Roseateles amylovorans TaxID=2978473 RepID=A0ABY6B7T4_9BURK|nr:cyclopropane-fatty-acyl-phospholipid synthase family protein [Roseateles amylovorans]UXH80899.1 cyclopropane-fatty-acyl-phospholipid synthase family protein [Roseateles amylovorans]
MSEPMSPLSARPAATTRRGAPLAARQVMRLLGALTEGVLELRTPDGQTHRLGTGARRATLQVHDWRVFSRALRRGDIGFAEDFIEGRWETPDLTALLSLMLANREALERVVYGAWWGRLTGLLRHALNRNTRAGSARNIHAHYDLGNAFYSLWLDPTMSYSSAWFEGNLEGDLVQAQHAKMRRALVEAGVTSGDRLLEIGCGWGAMAETAARDFGASVTGVTLSPAQLSWARMRVDCADMADRCDLRLQDYRDIASQPGHQPYDAVVSIEMFEAVGREYWDDYFATLRRCLKPGGRACIQSITIRDDLFDRYVRSTDFIQQYIFPGGLLPSVSVFETLARRHGFEVERRFAFGADYAQTLRHWRERFLECLPEVERQGFDVKFQRTWLFYLAYCEAAFALGNTDVVQFTLRRDGAAA